MNDLDFINDSWQQEIQSLQEDYNKWEKHTLAEHVRKCADILVRKIDNGLLAIKKSEISTYLYGELKKNDIEVSDRTIRGALPPDFKANTISGKAETISTSHEPIWNIISLEDSPVLVEQDQHGSIRVNGILQGPKREARESLKDIFTINIDDFRDETFDSIMNEYQTANTYAAYFKSVGEYYLDMHTAPLILENLEKTNKIGDEEKNKLIIEYTKRALVSEELQDPIFEHYHNTLEQSIKDISQAKTIRNEVDRREKWGAYSKIWQNYITRVESKANLADLIGYCSKYASIGIERNEEVTRFFKKMLSCPKCDCDIHREMNLLIEEDIRRDEQGLKSLLVPRVNSLSPSA